MTADTTSIQDEDYPPIQEVDDDGFITIYVTATKAKQPIKEFCEVCGAEINQGAEE